MTARGEARLFYASAAAFWAFLVVLAYLSPVQLDDWYQLTWHHHHDFGPTSIWQYAHYNYFNFNPRLGDTMLLIVNGPSWIHLTVTPLVELALPVLIYALAFARWPRPTVRDLQLLLAIQVFVWMIVPIPGVMYVYRPFLTNYVFAFAIVLGLFVPYRLALAKPAGSQRWPLVPVMVVAGWLAGMTNEHTGPTQMAAMLALIVYAWRARRLRAWMVGGAIGLFVGYPMLFRAPGQAVRYGGLGAQQSPVGQLAERGLGGNYQIILDFLGEAAIALEIALVALVLALCAAWLRRVAPRTFGRARVVAIAALIAAAGAIVVTLFASPVVGERLFFAPGVLFAAALALIVDYAIDDRGPRRLVVGLALAIFAWHAVRLVQVYARVHADNDDRLAALAAAPAGSVAVVPPYREWRRSRWVLGDDFQYGSLREYVANEVYALRGIELDRHERWVEPSPPDHFVATRTYDPPLSAADAQRLAAMPYVPTYWEWAFVQLRKLIAFASVGDVDGHQLVHYVVDDPDSGFDDPLHRPVHVLDWTPARSRFVEGRPFDDDDGTPYVRVWPSTVPANWTESYVVGCGHTHRVDAHRDDPRGPLIPVIFECRGTMSAIACEPEQCWLAGRYYR